MADNNRKYDFKQNRLGVRLRVMGAVAVFAGVVYVICAFIMHSIGQGASSHAQLLGMGPIVGIGLVGACLAVLGVLLLLLPSLTGLVGASKVVAAVLLALCIVLLVLSLLGSSSDRLAIAFAGVGVAVTGGIVPLINQGRVPQS